MDQTKLKEELLYRDGKFYWIRPKQGRARFKPAGSRTAEGYIYIHICGERHAAHRLAWLYVYGEWPKTPLDHVNRVKDDNRIENLRLTTPRENALNCNRSEARALPSNIYQDERGYMVIFYRLGKRYRSKRFKTLDAAIDWRGTNM